MSKFKIIGILPVFNEADVLNQTIAYTIRQGIPLVIVDNGSTDGSLAIERRFLGRGVLEVREVPPDPYYDIKRVLGEAHQTALSYSPDWLFHLNADEFIESPYPGLDLAKAIQNEAEFGYNMIQVNIFDFQLTERDYQSKVRDVRKRLRYYSWISDFHYRAWKNYPGTDLLVHGGHKPVFAPGVEEKISPFKFALRHYKFRSVEQGLNKVFKDRLPRYDPRNRALGWHVQYSAFKPDPRYFVVDSLKLNRYDEDGRWNLERVFDPYYGGWTPPYVEEHFPARELVKGLNQKIEAISHKLDATQGQISIMNQELESLKMATIHRLKESEAEISILKEDLDQTTLNDIRHSAGNKPMRFYASRIDKLFPDGTTRGEFRRVALASTRTVSEEGVTTYLRKVGEKLRRREFRILDRT